MGEAVGGKLWMHVQLSIYMPVVPVWATGTVARVFSIVVSWVTLAQELARQTSFLHSLT